MEYETGVVVCKVNDNGTVPFKGHPYRIGKALKQPYVALRAGQYAVYYCTRQIGKLTLRGAQNVEAMLNCVSGRYTPGRGTQGEGKSTRRAWR